MSEPKSRFSAGLKGLGEIGGKAPPPKLVEAPPAAERPAEIHQAGQGAKSRSASRIGKENISGWYDPAVGKQLSLLSVELDRTKQDLIAEALNLLFERHGKSAIAKG